MDYSPPRQALVNAEIVHLKLENLSCLVSGLARRWRMDSSQIQYSRAFRAWLRVQCRI